MKRRQFLAATGAALTVSGNFIRAASAATSAPLRVRKNLSSLDAGDSFFAKYGEAITKMHQLPENDPRSWRSQALIHGSFCPHGMSDFFAWHRQYITYFERICGELIGESGFALPYWDWTKDQGRLPGPFFDNGPLNVTFWNDRSNFNSPMFGQVNTIAARGISRTRGLQSDPRRGGSFTDRAINDITRLTRFSLFQRRLEGSPHNNAHVIAGASAAGTGHIGHGLSPLDPAFWLHHCNVDRLWAEWQAAGNTMPAQAQTYTGQFVDRKGNSQNATAQGAQKFTDLGFTYDGLVDSSVKALSRRLNLPTAAQQTQFLRALPAEVERTLGTFVNTSGSAPNLETRLAVKTEGLLDNLFASRKFRPTNMPNVQRFAVEQSRILAKINVFKETADASNLLVNVFVNCPYLSPELETADQHFADSFSFFGRAMKGKREVIVDVTRPLRIQAKDGRLATENVNVQLMPIPASNDIKTDAKFSIGSIELIRV